MEAGRGQNHEENNAQQLLGDKTRSPPRLRALRQRGDEAGPPPLGGPSPVAARGRRGGSSRCCRCRGDAARPRGMQAQGRGARRRGSAAGQGRKEPRAGTPTGTGTAPGGAGGWSRGDGGVGVLRVLRVPSARGGEQASGGAFPFLSPSLRLL